MEVIYFLGLLTVFNTAAMLRLLVSEVRLEKVWARHEKFIELLLLRWPEVPRAVADKSSELTGNFRANLLKEIEEAESRKKSAQHDYW